MLLRLFHRLWSARHPLADDWIIMWSPWPTFIACCLYIFLAKIVGPMAMANRKPLNVQTAIRGYNLLQVGLNAWMLYQLCDYNWWWNAGFWCQALSSDKTDLIFVMSWWFYVTRFLDQLDTFFFIARKKFQHISALHLFHHFIMPIYMWIHIRWAPGGFGSIGGLCNSFVHTVMYTYYFLASFGQRFQKFLWWKKYLTIVQMIQFVVILVYTAFPIFIPCDFPWQFSVFSISLMIILFVLFLQFYINAYHEAAMCQRKVE